MHIILVMCFKYPFDIYKCGKCPECLQDKRREWSIRLQLHTFFSGETPFFCHLTYDNKHVPINEYSELTLQKSDVQKFLKRLRQNLKTYYEKNKISNAPSIKYYCAGEYGPTGTLRPHYHCILFGLPKDLSEEAARTFVQKAWQNGDVRKRSEWLKSYSQLHYATKYMINYFDESFQNKTAPFRLCSSGFGKPYVDFAIKNNLYDKNIQLRFRCKYHVNKLNGRKKPVYWYKENPLIYNSDTGDYEVNPLLEQFRDFIEFEEVINGIPKVYRFPLPRYFAEKLYTEDFRAALAEVKNYKLLHKNADYHSQYLEYDKTSNKPMWLQLKNYLWQRKKKNKKDKFLRTDINSLLND